MQSEIDGMKERISHIDKLENKCMHLEDKCSSLEKSVEVLIKHWKHSNPPTIPDRSCWIDKGYDDEYIDETVNDFPNDIDRNISNILKGEDTDIHMGWEDEGEILMHDVAFDAHWEKLMEALKLVNHIDNMSLFIGCIQLTPDLLQILSRGLEVTKLTSLRLRNNDLPPQMREALEGVNGIVNTQSKMTSFEWENNIIDNMDDANFLLERIKVSQILAQKFSEGLYLILLVSTRLQIPIIHVRLIQPVCFILFKIQEAQKVYYQQINERT